MVNIFGLNWVSYCYVAVYASSVVSLVNCGTIPVGSHRDTRDPMLLAGEWNVKGDGELERYFSHNVVRRQLLISNKAEDRLERGGQMIVTEYFRSDGSMHNITTHEVVSPRHTNNRHSNGATYVANTLSIKRDTCAVLGACGGQATESRSTFDTARQTLTDPNVIQAFGVTVGTFLVSNAYNRAQAVLDGVIVSLSTNVGNFFINIGLKKAERQGPDNCGLDTKEKIVQPVSDKLYNFCVSLRDAAQESDVAQVAIQGTRPGDPNLANAPDQILYVKTFVTFNADNFGEICGGVDGFPANGFNP